MKKTTRCFRYAMIGLVLILASATTALAHVDPAGSTSTGIGISITAFRNDQITPIGGGSINQCETIYYQATISWAGGSNAAFEGGELRIQLPGQALPGTLVSPGGIPCVGGTANEGDGGLGETCAGSSTSFTSIMIPFTATVTDCTATPNLTANAIYSGGFAHNGVPDQAGVGAQTPFQSPVVCCPLNEGECKEDDFCDPTVPFGGTSGTQRLGDCVAGDPLADSTECVDTDGTLCTTSGCEAGVCVQAHATVSCPDDGEVCNGPEACVPGTGLCASGPNLADSTACTLEDTNECTTSGCEAGVCVATHVEVTCTDPICEICDTTTGACVERSPLPAECVPGDEICRTPGFWGTHGGDEKEEKSQNITQAVLDAYLDANGGVGPTICGQEINNTDVGNPASALEAICTSPKGDSSLQLFRQLTAAALNCIVTGSTGDPTLPAECGPGGTQPGLTGGVCSGISIETIFNACNTACANGDVVAEDVDVDGDPLTDPVDVSCIAAIDCFNNGFTLDADGVCTGNSSGCHDRELVNGCFDFQPPGAAGSPRACNEARKN